MHLPVLLRDRSRPAQVLLGGILPALIGSLAGLMVGASAAGYWAVGAVAAIGGFLAGLEHRDGWGGADRGMVGGAIYATSLALVHALVGNHARVSLGSSKVVFVIFITIIGIAIGAAGGRVARFVRERNGVFITDVAE
jgi:uncharacterized membrane protein